MWTTTRILYCVLRNKPKPKSKVRNLNTPYDSSTCGAIFSRNTFKQISSLWTFQQLLAQPSLFSVYWSLQAYFFAAFLKFWHIFNLDLLQWRGLLPCSCTGSNFSHSLLTPSSRLTYWMQSAQVLCLRNKPKLSALFHHAKQVTWGSWAQRLSHQMWPIHL